ncbi:conserved hypothetical protein [Mesorhizobium delmotii]|uniref:Transposase n=1 Tax=Mesorhizobium delmotii TaxID=1631247 RepID=A0A2P9AN53_9HYPH|nr:conserved hypothetical protein [Mesorhizobium delmotii]
MRPSRPSHDYKRPGTTTLFAALNVLDGTVIAQNMQRHRHQEFIRVLRQTHPAQAQARRLPFHCRSSAAINRFIREYNAENPRPFIWKPTPMTSSPPETAGSKRWNQSTRS